jgi:Flp pilus assembly protein CpaB
MQLRRLRYRPAVRWLVVVALAAASGLVAARVAGAAAEVRAEWGETASVVVVVGRVGAGETIGPGDVELRRLPKAVVPDDALTEPPEGRVAIVDLFPGEVLLRGRIAPDGLDGPAALLPPGARAVAVPTGPGTPPLAVGDRVDVLAGLDPFAVEPTTAIPTGPVVTDAVVVAVAEGAVTIAVPAGDAPRVAAALVQGAVSLALVGAG